MLVGHVGAGLLAKRLEPRLNLGLLCAAALFPDALLWILVLAGVESLGPVPSEGSARFFTFVFPWSHGVSASLVWTALAAAAGRAVAGARGAAVLGGAVLSHLALDLLVHVPDIPLAGSGSTVIGLGLWRWMPVALLVELGLALAAVLACLPVLRRKVLLVAATALAATLTAAGPYLPGPLPAPRALALSSLGVLALLVVAGLLADRGRPFARIAASGGPGPCP